MQKKRVFAVLFLVLLCLTAMRMDHKGRIFRLVNHNLPELTTAAEQILLTHPTEMVEVTDFVQVDGVCSAYAFDSTYVQFDCFGFGLVPSSSYYGCYYSADDTPKMFQNANLELVADRNGYRYEEPNSDNWGYTQKIRDNWYYYEMHF